MLKETVYSPDSLPNGIIPFYISIFKDIKRGHYLGKQLFIRDLKAQYRQSFLGLFWAFAPATVTALLWIFLKSADVVQVEVTGMSFAMFTITGTFLWQVITQSIKTTTDTVNKGKPILTKLNFPRESLLIYAIYTVGFNIAILFIVTCIIAFFLGWTPGWNTLLFPLVILDILLIGFSIGLVFISFFSLIADFSKFLPIGLQLAMSISAVIFPIPEQKNMASLIFNLNPFTHVVIFSRNFFMGINNTDFFGFIIVNIVALVLLLAGLMAYRISMPVIIERLGS